MNYPSAVTAEAERIFKTFYVNLPLNIDVIKYAAKCAIICLTELFNSVDNQQNGSDILEDFYQSQISYLKETYL